MRKAETIIKTFIFTMTFPFPLFPMANLSDRISVEKSPLSVKEECFRTDPDVFTNQTGSDFFGPNDGGKSRECDFLRYAAVAASFSFGRLLTASIAEAASGSVTIGITTGSSKYVT
jgi:hypothetical protein